MTFYPGHDDLDTPSLQSSDSSLDSSTLCASASLPALPPPSSYGAEFSDSELTAVAANNGTHVSEIKLVQVKLGGNKRRYVWLRAIKKVAKTVAVPRSLRLVRAWISAQE